MRASIYSLIARLASSTASIAFMRFNPLESKPVITSLIESSFTLSVNAPFTIPLMTSAVTPTNLSSGNSIISCTVSISGASAGVVSKSSAINFWLNHTDLSSTIASIDFSFFCLVNIKNSAVEFLICNVCMKTSWLHINL